MVAPKKEKLKMAQEVLNEQIKKLEKKKHELSIITEKLRILNDKLASKQIDSRVSKNDILVNSFILVPKLESFAISKIY